MFDANVVLQQLGGQGRLKAMLGAKNFSQCKDENRVEFRIGRNAKGVSIVRITLTPEDTYNVEFGRIRKFDYKVLSSVEGIYCDMLKEVVEENTGMFLTLF